MNNNDVLIALVQCKDELDQIYKSIGTLGVLSPVIPYLTRYAIVSAHPETHNELKYMKIY